MKLAMALLAALAGIAIGHAMFSFYWLTFDPSLWTPEARYCALNIYLLFGGLAAAVTWGSEK